MGVKKLRHLKFIKLYRQMPLEPQKYLILFFNLNTGRRTTCSSRRKVPNLCNGSKHINKRNGLNGLHQTARY